MAPRIVKVRELQVQFTAHAVAAPLSGPVQHPAEAARLIHTIIGPSDVERVVALHFDTRRQLIGYQLVSIGTLNEAHCHPREVFKAAILANAASLIIAHNHPSGDPTPSREDVLVARRLAECGRTFGIPLDDSIVTADTSCGLRYVSLKLQGLLDLEPVEHTRTAKPEGVATVMLTDSEKRILRAALREFAASVQSDFQTLRQYHSFLTDGDEETDMRGLALKLGVELEK
jgi:DNA repair protein RadC